MQSTQKCKLRDNRDIRVLEIISEEVIQCNRLTKKENYAIAQIKSSLNRKGSKSSE
jgi:hypothetical protein